MAIDIDKIIYQSAVSFFSSSSFYFVDIGSPTRRIVVIKKYYLCMFLSFVEKL